MGSCAAAVHQVSSSRHLLAHSTSSIHSGFTSNTIGGVAPARDFRPCQMLVLCCFCLHNSWQQLPTLDSPILPCNRLVCLD
jgi:hypothetical protein